jgi:CRISPR-associated protein Csm5
VLYAISKKKRPPREGESGSPELKVFLETVPDALSAVFLGELRLEGKIEWNALCNACNGFYKPQLEAELRHAVLAGLIDTDWKKLITGLLDGELGELIAARQGFVLRVGRHSGAESVTLDGVRDIKILGPRVEGKQTFDFRPNTTEKRFASLTKSGADGLLPFGWLWIDACDDAHRHLADAMCQKLAARSATLIEAHQEQLLRLEDSQQRRAAAAAETARRQLAATIAVQIQADAEAARQVARASMSPNLRRIEDFKEAFDARAKQLRDGGKDNPNTKYHDMARALARDAAGWSNKEEKLATADAIEEWLPVVVRVDIKDERKKLKLSALRGST